MKRLLAILLLALGGCSHVVLCCPAHGGRIESTTFDFMGNTALTCGTNSASIGNTNALGAAAMQLLGQAAKGAIVAAAKPEPPYVCQ